MGVRGKKTDTSFEVLLIFTSFPLLTLSYKNDILLI